ncbi:MAG: type II toxin-antitoxin system RelE/ParE family toxin [Geoalkalibacter sp.]|uniref:type II toxin-antitoxin system RelE/ParE family toxin n=1 Tax=Geoalkalibacter sp. TaxID=3041440 RepID=UPI003D0F5ECC
MRSLLTRCVPDWPQNTPEHDELSRHLYTPEAEDQLVALYHYIAEKTSPEIAAQYTEGIVSYCESLHTFPHRGIMRDDVRPGLRITNSTFADEKYL